MFSFFHRTPKIHLDCFTNLTLVYEHTPIVRTSKTIPEWWKELPPYKPVFGKTEKYDFVLLDKRTAKDCYAFIELYKRGVVIENWADLRIKSTEENFHYCYSFGPIPSVHPREQIGRGFENFHHLKLTSPWMIKEKSGASFLWLGAEWSLDNLNIKVLPGVMNFSITKSTNINFMFPKKEDEFTIPVGQPMVQIVPLSEKQLTVKNHFVTQPEFEKLKHSSESLSFFGWRKAVEMINRNEKRNKKCPFGFGD